MYRSVGLLINLLFIVSNGILRLCLSGVRPETVIFYFESDPNARQSRPG